MQKTDIYQIREHVFSYLRQVVRYDGDGDEYGEAPRWPKPPRLP